MLISGGTMFGNCATGRLNIETAPMSTIKMAMTIATIGRLMKNLYMAQTWRENYLGGFDGVAELVSDPNGLGFTITPSFTFCAPSTTMRSPALRPLSITQFAPTCSPTFTGC